MTVNVPLLRKTLEHITDHPEEHHQGVWAIKTACGTACCVAGWAVQFAGHTVQFDQFGHGYALTDTGDLRRISPLARDELGLTDSQANWLFSGDLSLRDIYAVAHILTDGEIDIPDALPGR